MDENLVPAGLKSVKGSDDVRALFVPRSDLSYLLVEGLDFAHVDIQQSLLTGAILRHCTFTSVDFRRCDLDGMRAEECQFLECDFESADVRSSIFSRCLFRKTSFDGVYMTDSLFQRCSLEDMPLTGVITQNTFSDGEMTRVSFARSSSTLNRFEQIRFKESMLGDCTFLYNLVVGCSFRDTIINSESIGMTFGIKMEDLPSLSFVYLGQSQPVPGDANLVDLLIESYAQRRWGIGVATLRLNFSLTSVAFALQDYLRFMLLSLREGRVLKTEEVQFLSNVMAELRLQQRLPFSSVAYALEQSSDLLSRIYKGDLSDGRAEQTLVRFSNTMFVSVQQMLDEFGEFRVRLPEGAPDQPAILEIAFVEQPSLSTADLLNEISDAACLPVLSRSETLDVKHGSYIEVIQTTVLSALGLQLFLFFLNGCIIQLTEMKARIQALRKKRPPISYLRRAERPEQEVPQYLVKPMRHMLEYIGKLNWLPDPKLKGFATENILSARLVPGDNRQEDN